MLNTECKNCEELQALLIKSMEQTDRAINLLDITQTQLAKLLQIENKSHA